MYLSGDETQRLLYWKSATRTRRRTSVEPVWRSHVSVKLYMPYASPKLSGTHTNSPDAQAVGGWKPLLQRTTMVDRADSPQSHRRGTYILQCPFHFPPGELHCPLATLSPVTSLSSGLMVVAYRSRLHILPVCTSRSPTDTPPRSSHGGLNVGLDSRPSGCSI